MSGDRADPWTALADLGPPDPTVAALARACAADDAAGAGAGRVMGTITDTRAHTRRCSPISARERAMVMAVWAAGAEATFIDGAARLVPDAPASLGAGIGRLLRRRKPQPGTVWVELAGETGATPAQLAATIGVLIETLIDDLQRATGIARGEVSDRVWRTSPPG